MTETGTLRDPIAPLDQTLLETASVWYTRRRDLKDDPTGLATVIPEFDAWLAEDWRHAQAYREIEQLWGALEKPSVARAEADGLVDPEGLDSDRPIPLETPKPIPTNRPAAATWIAMAASLVVLLGSALLLQDSIRIAYLADHTTGTAEVEYVTLADGSQVNLNANSAISVHFDDPATRRVSLLSGEALFEVAKQTDRPFVVTTEAGKVRVTGTKFLVRAEGPETSVHLIEGAVVLTPARDEGAAQTLSPGFQSVVAMASISKPQPFNATIETDWLRGQHVFRQTPLSSVVETLNAYHPGRIIIANDRLNELRLSGVVATNDPGEALDMVTATLPVQMTKLTDYLIILH